MPFDRNEILVYWGNRAVVSIEKIYVYDESMVKRFNIKLNDSIFIQRAIKFVSRIKVKK